MNKLFKDIMQGTQMEYDLHLLVELLNSADRPWTADELSEILMFRKAYLGSILEMACILGVLDMDRGHSVNWYKLKKQDISYAS